MEKLWNAIQQNVSFLLISVLVAAGVILLAKLLERKIIPIRKVTKTRRITIIAVCSAIAAILHMLDFAVPFLAPGFYKLDFSEVPVMLCGFFLGPSAAVAVEAIKIVLKLLLKGTSTAFVGDFANFVVGCSFAIPATAVYHFHKSRRGAFWGLATGTLCMAVFGSFFNAVYLIPKFAQLFGMPIEDIVAAGGAIFPGVRSVTTLVLYCVVPLNVVKGGAVGLLTMLLYKKVARPLFGKE